jgi:hypothetical protein
MRTFNQRSSFLTPTTSAGVISAERSFLSKTKIIHGTNNKENVKTTINYHGTLFHDSLLLYCNISLTNHGIVETNLQPTQLFSHTTCISVRYNSNERSFLSKPKIIHPTNNKEKAATYKRTINYHGTLFHDSLLLYCYLLLTNHGIIQVWLVCDDIFRFAFAPIIPTSPRTMQSHSTKIQLTRLGVGAPCIHKKGAIPARIIRTLGEKKWLVELLDDKTGKPTGLTKEVKSQMLRRPKPEDNHPLLRADSSSETSIAVDEVRQPQSNANSSLTQVRLQESIEGVELTLVQESQQVLENNPFTGESGIQESENNEGQPVIHQNTNRQLSKVARATVALLASPFKRRSLSKPSGESLSASSASSYEYQVPYKSSDEESNGNGEIPTSLDLDQEEDLVDGNELSNTYNENPASSDIDPDLEMEEELGNYRHEDEGDLAGVNILAMGQAVEQEDDKYKKSGIVTRWRSKPCLTRASASTASQQHSKGLILALELKSAAARSAKALS